MHANIAHLMINMVNLWGIASKPLLEDLSGRERFLCVYAAGGLCGSLLSLSLNLHPSVGASGGLL